MRQQHGLQFLSEAKLAHMVEPQLDPEKLATLSELAGGDLIAYQQYLDFVRFRRFRQTLLCHRESVSAAIICKSDCGTCWWRLP